MTAYPQAGDEVECPQCEGKPQYDWKRAPGDGRSCTLCGGWGIVAAEDAAAHTLSRLAHDGDGDEPVNLVEPSAGQINRALTNVLGIPVLIANMDRGPLGTTINVPKLGASALGEEDGDGDD